MAVFDQFVGQVAGALGGPKQGRFGVSTSGGLEQRVEVVEKSWVAFGEARASCSRLADPVGGRFGRGLVEFGDSGSDGRP